MAEEAHRNIRPLLERARAGDREAFDQLLVHYENTIMKTALFLTNNLDDAEDVAQEVYVKIIRHAGNLSSLDNPGGWIYRITVNAARDLLRKRRLWLPLKQMVQRSLPHDPIRQSEFQSRLAAALHRLSFNERAVFIFKEMQEMETSEIAEVLGCKPVTVRGHLLSARRKLRNEFKDFREQ